MKFRLQRVLDLRGAQERIAQQELAARQQEYHLILCRIDRLVKDEEALFALIKEQDKTCLDLPRLKHFYSYSEELKSALAEQELNKQRSLAQVEQQREAVKGCWQKRRMLEILQSKAEISFKEAFGEEEQKRLDEAVLFSFAKKYRNRNGQG